MATSPALPQGFCHAWCWRAVIAQEEQLGSGAHQLSAIDIENVTGDPAGFVRQQKESGISHVAGLPKPFDGHGL
tara:strand:+ start:496 stop:717 length:222 start_codon:yes stop_codon:yes gene_type:complete